jgi:hypothetical protein
MYGTVRECEHRTENHSIQLYHSIRRPGKHAWVSVVLADAVLVGSIRAQKMLCECPVSVRESSRLVAVSHTFTWRSSDPLIR